MKVSFGVHFEPLFGFGYQTIENVTLNAERAGYDSVWTCDHFFKDTASVDINSLEAWTLLTALGAKTSKLKLGVLVTCNSYRPPALLAKMAATLDMVANGRLIFGIGAGWKRVEYEAYGYPFPSLRERMDRLEEALQVILKLWTEGRANFEGEYYRLKDAVFAPKPVQKPYPPILIGGHGEKRTLKLVAHYGNLSNFSPWASERIPRLLKTLEDHCETVGRSYESITKTFLGYCFITDNQEEIKEFNKRRAREQGITLDQYEEKQSHLPGAWAGSIDDIRLQYEHLVGMGFSHFPVLFPYGKELGMSNEFAQQVVRKLR
ncbi:MAG: TIGR03560 family F420-dependent LLM class oxidoreductase [Candidatus Thorarchaeota archaeon]